MIYFMEHLKIPENKMDDFQGYPQPLGNLHLGEAWLAGAFKIFEIFCYMLFSVHVVCASSQVSCAQTSSRFVHIPGYILIFVAGKSDLFAS
jgi:hypothetical protein